MYTDLKVVYADVSFQGYSGCQFGKLYEKNPFTMLECAVDNE